MGKRSNFVKIQNDKYYTPYDAFVPVLPFLVGKEFIEPCAGDGRLIHHLEKHGFKCVYACDIEPDGDTRIQKQDVLFFGVPLPPCDFIITNPPWEREALHQMIEKFRNHAPTWLLFQSDWHDTKQCKTFMRFCSAIVPVGRISWMENGVSGMENCSWYLFDKFENNGYAKFFI